VSWLARARLQGSICKLTGMMKLLHFSFPSRDFILSSSSILKLSSNLNSGKMARRFSYSSSSMLRMSYVAGRGFGSSRGELDL